MNQEQLLQRILVIDNHQDDRALIIQALTRELPGIQVKEILNSDRLNQAIATLDFDLVLIHEPLSWTTGLDLVRRLKAQSNCSMIMFTDSGDLNVAVAAMKAGLDDYVVQSPDDTAPLIQAVRSVLQNTQTRRDRLGVSPTQPEVLYGIPFNDSPNPMWIYDPETLRFLAVNQAAINRYGYSETEFLSMTIAQIRPPDDVPALLKRVADIGLISRSGEWRHLKRNGTLIDVEISSHQIIWQNRRVRLVMVNDITDRKAAETRLRQQAERERLIRTVTEHIRQSLNLDEILTKTVTEVRHILKADRVLIYQLEPDGSGYVVQESVAADWPAILGRKLFDPCFPMGCMEQYFQGRVQAIADIDDGSIQTCHADFLRQYDVRANLVVSILQTDRLWGLLIVHQCSQPRCWLVEETHLLQQLADQVSIALQQAQLYQQLRAELAERQRAEAALRASETRFRKLAANVPGVIYQYVLHPDGSDEVLYMSPGSQSLWEVDAPEIEKDISLIWNLVHPDDELAMRASILASAQSLQPWLWEWRMITPSGLLKWVRATAQPELQSNGDIVWDGLLMDISDRKTAELLLQQQAQQAQALNRVVQSIRNSLDLPTIFATATAEVTQLLGVHRTAIVQYFPDRSCWRVVACHRLDESLPDTTGFEIPDEINPYATQLKQFQIVRIDLPVVFLTAHTDDATLTEAIATHPQGYVVKPFEEQDLSVAIQVALANHRAEQAIQQTLEKEKQLNELKSQFVSMVSHEFRNPLTTLLCALDILEEPNSFTREQQLTYIQLGKTAIKQMSQLITDVLVLGEVEREQFQCQCEPVDIVQFCSSLVEVLKSRPQTKHNLVLNVRGCDETEHPFYELDPKLLQHILTNLLENAVKYSPAGSQVTFELHCKPDYIQFQIQDQGIGLTKQDQEKLFTPFHRGSNVGKIRGTGLGLSIVKKCVDAHQGKIAVESEVGIGTLFTVTLYSENSFQDKRI